jgi:hypothetical protein
MAHKEVTKIRPRTLLDPYGFSLDDSVVRVQTTMSTGNPVRRNVFGYDLTLRFDLNLLKASLTIPKKEFARLALRHATRKRMSRVRGLFQIIFRTYMLLNRKALRLAQGLGRVFVDGNFRKFERLRIYDLVPEAHLWTQFDIDGVNKGGEWGSEIVSERRFMDRNFFYWMALLKEEPRLHSNQFQYHAILDKACPMVSGSHDMPKAIGFGVGSEPIPAALVDLGFEVTATDYLDGEQAREWQATGQLISSPMGLNNRGIADAKDFEARFHFRNMDMNDIPEHLNSSFDLVWSTCALGHIGGYQKGLDFIVRSARLLKPGGWAVHSTEIDLSHEPERFDTPSLSLYKLEDLMTLVQRLKQEGNLVMPIKETAWQGLSEKYIATEPWGEKPHLRIRVLGREIASIVLVFQRQ